MTIHGHMRFAKKWYQNFKKEYEKSPYPSGVFKWKFWTKTNLDLLQKLGEKIGYVVLREKPVKMDMTWYNPRHFEPEVAIEYETNKKGILDSELRNLAFCSAKLKVLMTYVRKEEQEDFLKKIVDRWKKRSKRVWNDELLVMFIVYHQERRTRFFDYFQGYVIYPFKGKLLVKYLEPFISFSA